MVMEMKREKRGGEGVGLGGEGEVGEDLAVVEEDLVRKSSITYGGVRGLM